MNNLFATVARAGNTRGHGTSREWPDSGQYAAVPVSIWFILGFWLWSIVLTQKLPNTRLPPHLIIFQRRLRLQSTLVPRLEARVGGRQGASTCWRR